MAPHPAGIGYRDTAAATDGPHLDPLSLSGTTGFTSDDSDPTGSAVKTSWAAATSVLTREVGDLATKSDQGQRFDGCALGLVLRVVPWSPGARTPLVVATAPRPDAAGLGGWTAVKGQPNGCHAVLSVGPVDAVPGALVPGGKGVPRPSPLGAPIPTVPPTPKALATRLSGLRSLVAPLASRPLKAVSG